MKHILIPIILSILLLTSPLYGTKYMGEWKDLKKHGQGTETWSNGEMYVGEFKDGYRNGQGTYTWPGGNKYVGGFKDDKPTYLFPSDQVYVPLP
jgi:hypothetical protein